MARVEVILSGSPISDIRTSLAKNQILSGDLFYISQQQLSNVGPDRTYDSGTTIYSNQFKSAKMSYDTLSNMMLERFREYANFGTMAWESSSDYSLAHHIHNYSKVEITSHNKPIDNEGQMLSIASFQIDHTVKKVLWVAKPKEYRMPEPNIGQLKFLALTSIPNVDETASGFDGWTWPDGRTIQNTNGRFARAAAYFGNGANVSEFTLPTLADFFRAAGLGDSDSTIGSLIAQRDVLLAHNHQVPALQPTGNQTTTTLNIGFHKGGVTKDTGCHAYNGATDRNSFKFNVKFDIKNIQINGGDVSNNQPILAGETYPTHNLLPVMIYIGKPSS